MRRSELSLQAETVLLTSLMLVCLVQALGLVLGIFVWWMALGPAGYDELREQRQRRDKKDGADNR